MIIKVILSLNIFSIIKEKRNLIKINELGFLNNEIIKKDYIKKFKF